MSLWAVLVLALYALVVGRSFDRRLAGAEWVSRWPRLAIWAWHGGAVACLTAVAASALLLAHDPLEHALVWLLHADAAKIHQLYAGATSGDPFLSLARDVAFLLPAAVLLATSAAVAVRNVKVVRERRRIRRMLAVVGHGRPDRVVLVDNEQPSAMCLPDGRQSLIVVTSGAVRSLTTGQLRAVIAHENAHLRLRHHLMVLVADSVSDVLGRLGLMTSYADQIRHLVELDADDVASRRHGPTSVAAALVALSSPPAPRAAGAGLHMAATGVGPRVRRLLRASRAASRPATLPFHRCATVAGMTTVAVGALAPFGVLVIPALSLAGSAH